MRILLVQPAPFEPGRLGLENVLWMSEPLALTSIAAMIPEHEVRILDLRLEKDTELNRALLEFRPDLVGTTAMTTDCYQAQAVLETAKSTLGPSVFTIVGGHHPTMSPETYDDLSIDAVCLGEGEDTFLELIHHLSVGNSPHALDHIAGLRFRDANGRRVNTAKRAQQRDLDTFPPAARHLLPKGYRKEYFFAVASGMASIQTSRGCSFDCNFCAIWEFYERRTRYMSAEAICDRMEAIEERFIFFMDDNFLTNRKRIIALCEEIERRGIKKYFGVQGRSDFVADNPAVMKRLRDCGLVMVLSGYESNSDDALAALRKSNTYQKNLEASRTLRRLGIVSTGIFMVRPDFEEHQFDDLYRTINEMQVAIPLVTILTPLPGTQLFRQRRKELLTEDVRLFDLLHAVLPTRLPRRRFYEKYAEWGSATDPSFRNGALAAVLRRPGFFLRALPGILTWAGRALNYRPVVTSPESHLRDEIGIIPAESPLGTRGAEVLEFPTAGAEPTLVPLAMRASR